MGFDNGGCLFWGRQCQIMSYLVGGFCFGLNFWIFVPLGGKLWEDFGWSETISPEDSGDRADGINKKTVSGKHGDVLLPLFSQSLLYTNI